MDLSRIVSKNCFCILLFFFKKIHLAHCFYQLLFKKLFSKSVTQKTKNVEHNLNVLSVSVLKFQKNITYF